MGRREGRRDGGVEPGRCIGDDRVISTLAAGGMGVVLLAEHERLGRRVALKLLKPELGDDRDALSRFADEALTVSQLRHEHIVEVTGFGTTPEGETYIVMELLEGASLAARLAGEGPFSADRAAAIAVQVASALEAAHALGIVHRDLKPGNVFLVERQGNRDYVKVLDFGMAKLVGPARSERARTRAGMVIGTPQYMSPEQGQAGAAIDHRTDVYALGVMLYEMVTGEPPFTAKNWVGVLVQHATARFPSAREKRPDLSPAFERVLERAVAKRPEERWESMAELREALLRLLDERALPGTPVPAVPRATPALGSPGVPMALAPTLRSDAHDLGPADTREIDPESTLTDEREARGRRRPKARPRPPISRPLRDRARRPGRRQPARARRTARAARRSTLAWSTRSVPTCRPGSPSRRSSGRCARGGKTRARSSRRTWRTCSRWRATSSPPSSPRRRGLPSASAELLRELGVVPAGR